MSDAKNNLRAKIDRNMERKMMGNTDDRTRYLKFAAYLATYDSDDAVIKEAAATIREIADKLEAAEATIKELKAKHVETIDGWDLPSAMNRIDELEAVEQKLRELGEVVDILEEAGEYCDCSCGTGHARLIKKALNRGDV
jgi:Mg2+ and Co2+ transporter CorA